MPLVAGDKLGPYEVAAQIGVGGMGRERGCIDAAHRRAELAGGIEEVDR